MFLFFKPSTLHNFPDTGKGEWEKVKFDALGSGGPESGPPATNPSCPALIPLAFDQIGGYEQLEAAYAQAIPSRTIANTTCHLPRADAMHMFRDPYTGDLPWTGMTFGLTIMATWYWCTDQVSVNPVHPPAFWAGLWRVQVAQRPGPGKAPWTPAW